MTDTNRSPLVSAADDLVRFLGWQPFDAPWFIGRMEVFVSRADGGYRLPFPVSCYDVDPFRGAESAVWQNASTGERLAVSPTFWRPWDAKYRRANGSGGSQ